MEVGSESSGVMAKRFIDTSIFRKDFIRGLDAPYKLLFLYLINECDHAGLWDVEIEVAEVRLGVKIGGDPIAKFCGKVIPVDGGKKWFIPSFISFQYGQLNPENRAHGSAISLLKKFNLLTDQYEIKPLTSPLQGAMDMDKEMDKEMDMVKVKEKRAENEKQKPPHPGVIEVIQHLNELNGTNLRTDTKATVRLIEQRFAEGYTLTELKEIVEYKVAEWKSTEMEKYLQPDTLFNGEKCAKYRNQVQAAKDKGLTAQQIKGNGSNNSKLYKDDLGQRVAALYK